MFHVEIMELVSSEFGSQILLTRKKYKDTMDYRFYIGFYPRGEKMWQIWNDDLFLFIHLFPEWLGLNSRVMFKGRGDFARGPTNYFSHAVACFPSTNKAIIH